MGRGVKLGAETLSCREGFTFIMESGLTAEGGPELLRVFGLGSTRLIVWKGGSLVGEAITGIKLGAKAEREVIHCLGLGV